MSSFDKGKAAAYTLLYDPYGTAKSELVYRQKITHPQKGPVTTHSKDVARRPPLHSLTNQEYGSFTNESKTWDEKRTSLAMRASACARRVSNHTSKSAGIRCTTSSYGVRAPRHRSTPHTLPPSGHRAAVLSSHQRRSDGRVRAAVRLSRPDVGRAGEAGPPGRPPDHATAQRGRQPLRPQLAQQVRLPCVRAVLGVPHLGRATGRIDGTAAAGGCVVAQRCRRPLHGDAATVVGCAAAIRSSISKVRTGRGASRALDGARLTVRPTRPPVRVPLLLLLQLRLELKCAGCSALLRACVGAGVTGAVASAAVAVCVCTATKTMRSLRTWHACAQQLPQCAAHHASSDTSRAVYRRDNRPQHAWFEL